MMRLLGAVLAGGRSSRFGSDKALAELHGRPLIDHAIQALAAQTDAVVVCGRAWGDQWVADRPAPDLGPLGGINAALHAAIERGFGAVLTIPCDAPLLPGDLRDRLTGSGGAFCAEMPVIGLWPIAVAESLDRWLAGDAANSVRGWARSVGALPVELGGILHNVNTPENLQALRAIVPRS